MLFQVLCFAEIFECLCKSLNVTPFGFFPTFLIYIFFSVYITYGNSVPLSILGFSG